MTTTEIKVGQIWRDCCEAGDPRYLIVEAVGETAVTCRTLKSGRTSLIRKDRMRPFSRGYALVTDPQLLAQLHELFRQRAQPVAKVTQAVVPPPQPAQKATSFHEFMQNLEKTLTSLRQLLVALQSPH